MSIALRIKELRLKNKLSQIQFATVLGTSRSNIGQIEAGNQLPTLKILSEIVRNYNTSYDFLIDGIDRDKTRISTEVQSSIPDMKDLLNKIIELSADKTRLEIELEELKIKRRDPVRHLSDVSEKQESTTIKHL
jgi:transcriptional regulator with XRE-family HTH domain